MVSGNHMVCWGSNLIGQLLARVNVLPTVLLLWPLFHCFALEESLLKGLVVSGELPLLHSLCIFSEKDDPSEQRKFLPSLLMLTCRNHQKSWPRSICRLTWQNKVFMLTLTRRLALKSYHLFFACFYFITYLTLAETQFQSMPANYYVQANQISLLFLPTFFNQYHTVEFLFSPAFRSLNSRKFILIPLSTFHQTCCDCMPVRFTNTCSFVDYLQ